MVNKEDWIQWKNDKVAREFIGLLQKKIEFFKDDWANHRFEEEYEHYILMGQVQALQDVIYLVLNEFPVIEEPTNAD